MSHPESKAALTKGDRLQSRYSGNVIVITGECARGYEAEVISLGVGQTYKQKDLVIGRSWWVFYDKKEQKT